MRIIPKKLLTFCCSLTCFFGMSYGGICLSEPTISPQAEPAPQVGQQQLPKHHPKKVNIPIEHWTHKSGVSVYFVQANDIPIMDFRLTFNAGGARDGTLPGLAQMTSGLLEEGTDKLTVNDIAEQFESIGAQFSTGSYRDMATISLRTLTRNKEIQKALSLSADIISKPSFPETAVERIRSQMLINLQHKKQNPSALIEQTKWSTLYANHPYGSDPDGTEDSLKSITVDDIKRFHQTFYVANNVQIAIVGAATKEQVNQWLDILLANLSEGERAAPLPEVKIPKAFKPVHITFPSQQTHISISTISVKRNSLTNNNAYITLSLANEAFGGGGFNSILNEVIRQENGFTYSIYSYFSAMQSKGPFTINLQTKNSQAAKALNMVDTLYAAFLKEGISAKRLESARNNQRASFPLKVSSNSSILGYLGAIGFYKQPLNWFETYLDEIETVSEQDIKKLLSQTLATYPTLTITLGPTDPLKSP